MIRKLATCLILFVLVTAWPASGVYAQAAPAAAHPEQIQRDDRGKNTTPPAGFQAGRGTPASNSGRNNNAGNTGNAGKNGNNKPAPAPNVYSQQVAGVLIGQFDRAMGEIDAAPGNMSPTDVKNATFRRRLLELRLLMDTNNFAYNHDQMKTYRDVIDAAYQAIGDYQDISVIQKLVPSIQINQDIINVRLNQMNDTMGPLRDQGWRNEVHSFFSDPRPNVRTSPGSPRLWDEAEVRASDQYDQVGNAALLEASILRHLQNQDLGIADIRNPDQKIYFHDVRKEMRSIIVLSSLLPDTAAATQDVTKPLQSFVDDYGNANDAYTAWDMANQMGSGVDDANTLLDQMFAKAQDEKNDLIASNGLAAMAERLEAVRDAHRVS
jgi:hypothetical protein